MAKVGVPPKYRKKFHNEDFLKLSLKGKNITQIAAEWRVSRKTIYNWSDEYPEFLHAVELGKTFCEAWYINMGQTAMIGQARNEGKPIKIDTHLFSILMRNMFSWDKKDKWSGNSDLESDEALKLMEEAKHIKDLSLEEKIKLLEKEIKRLKEEKDAT